MATEIHRWEMEYGLTIVDQVGSADGTAISTPTEEIGVLGTARGFTGSTDRIDCGDPSDLNFGSSDWTIRAIFRRDQTSRTYDKYVVAKDLSTSRGYALYTDNNSFTLHAYVYVGSTIYQVDCPYIVADGLYHDAVMIKEGDTLSVYVDGAYIDSVTLPSITIDTSTANFTIGNGYNYNNNYLQGDVDYVQVWSGALTAEEVSALHYAPLGTISLDYTDPYNGETGVTLSGLVDISIADSANTVDLSTIEVTIGGSLAFDGDGGLWQSGYNGPASGLSSDGSGGYDITIDPTSNFAYEDNIVVNVYAENDQGHILDELFSFVTEEDTSAPVLEDLNPVSGQTGVTRNTNIYLEVFDAQTEIDPTSVAIYIDRDEGAGFELAYDNDGGGFQTGYSGSFNVDPVDGAHRYNIDINPTDNLLDGRTVQVRVIASNVSTPVTETLDTIYSFTTLADTDSPIVENANPANAAAAQPKDTSIYFEIYDSDVGVSTNSIIPWVDRDEGAGFEPVWNVNSGGWYPGWSGTIEEDPIEGINRFNITLIPDTEFVEGADISVRVRATDVSYPTPNPLDTTYSFGIAIYPSAYSPLASLDGIPRWGDLEISAYGGSGGLILSSMKIWLDEALVYDGSSGGFQLGFAGENSDVQFVVTGYDFTIDPEEDLDPDTFYTLSISGINDLGFSL